MTPDIRVGRRFTKFCTRTVLYIQLQINTKPALASANEVMLGFVDLLKQSKIAKGDVRRELFDTITRSVCGMHDYHGTRTALRLITYTTKSHYV